MPAPRGQAPCRDQIARSLALRAVERLERERLAVGQHHLRDIEGHRDGSVVAAYADEIDHPLLAQQRLRAVESRFIDLPGAVKLDAEIVNRRLIIGHGGGPPAEGKLIGYPWVEALQCSSKDGTLPHRCRKYRVVHHSKFRHPMSQMSLGCAKTKSDLVLMPSEKQVFAFFCSAPDHKPQNSECSHTAQRFHTARVKGGGLQRVPIIVVRSPNA
jgi:hypothetical protein